MPKGISEQQRLWISISNGEQVQKVEKRKGKTGKRKEQRKLTDFRAVFLSPVLPFSPFRFPVNETNPPQPGESVSCYRLQQEQNDSPG
jgi:hypothetical protein